MISIPWSVRAQQRLGNFLSSQPADTNVLQPFQLRIRAFSFLSYLLSFLLLSSQLGHFLRKNVRTSEAGVQANVFLSSPFFYFVAFQYIPLYRRRAARIRNEHPRKPSGESEAKLMSLNNFRFSVSFAPEAPTSNRSQKVFSIFKFEMSTRENPLKNS